MILTKSIKLILPILCILFIIPVPLLTLHSFLLLITALGLITYFHINEIFSISEIYIPYLLLACFIFFNLFDLQFQEVGTYLSYYISSVLILIIFSQEKIQRLFLQSLAKFSKYIKVILIGLLLCAIVVKLLFKEHLISSQLGTGQNYYSAYMVVLLPFIFSTRSLSEKLLSISFVGLLISYCLMFSIRGSLLGAVFSCIFISILYWKFRYKDILLIIFFFIFSVSLFFLGDMHLEFNKHFELGRLYDVKMSIRMFLDNIVSGIGTEQWREQVFNYPLHEYYPVSLYYNKIVQPNIHNLHMKRLSEWGLFSAFYYVPIIWLLLKNLYHWKEINIFSKKLVLVLFIILGLQTIYRSAGHLVNHFSMIEVILFATMGLLIKGNYKIKVSGVYVLYIIIFLAVCIRLFSTNLPLNNLVTPNNLVIKTRRELALNPNNDSILTNTELMKFWFPKWNEALALEMEFYYNNNNHELFKNRVNQILNNKDNKPYLVYCWFYSIDYLSNQGDISPQALKYWKTNRSEIEFQLQGLVQDRQRGDSENISLRGRMKHYIQKNKIEINGI